ncbi:hypothetical protein MSAN_01888900 [Mycena sanguinolenta]|uniref:Uncharacterized protein n=1 Tax=Mycena sanguinolenta TaxID=230812 RepID=A0A8H7CPA2_9AGAR|nr:hypothetical protein MSAN_01888900 [Mycena sanguinolenta]
MAFAPMLHAFYCTSLQQLVEWDHAQEHAKHILPNFPSHLFIFSTATFNFGPATATFPHLDFRNLAWGWCTITALGQLDPDRGGHLVLWDLKLIVRFPPGSTILIPSAILHHSNTSVQAHETQFSFTQFTPAALFHWVYSRFHMDKNVDPSPSTGPKEHVQRRWDRVHRWEEGIKMYQRWDGPIHML